jgi:hypothetical protein
MGTTDKRLEKKLVRGELVTGGMGGMGVMAIDGGAGAGRGGVP